MENGDVGMMGSALALGGLCFVVVGFAIAAFLLAGLWKMFTKAGKPGWTAIVPIYNGYVMLQLVGLPVHWFYYFIILSLVGTVLPFLSLFTSVGTLVLAFYVVRMVHRAYGLNDDTVSVVINLFVPFVLVYRAGYGPAQYLGPQSTHDLPNLPWIDNMPQSNSPQAPSLTPLNTNDIPAMSSHLPNETPLVNQQPQNIPPVSGGPSDPGVDMGSLPQMGNKKDQEQ